MKVHQPLKKKLLMDVIFLYSKERNWKENYGRAISVFGDKVKLLNGSVGSIKKAYELIVGSSSTHNFVMIEGDNWVYDNAIDILQVNKPSKFFTDNDYGISYEHGGIKILNTEYVSSQLKNNVSILDKFEVSANFQLDQIPLAISKHKFNYDENNEWVTIAKEFIKLYYWGQFEFIERWTKNERAAEIYENVLEIIKESSFTSLFTFILPNLEIIYVARFKDKSNYSKYIQK